MNFNLMSTFSLPQPDGPACINMMGSINLECNRNEFLAVSAPLARHAARRQVQEGDPVLGALPGQGAGQVRLAGSRRPSQEEGGGGLSEIWGNHAT